MTSPEGRLRCGRPSAFVPAILPPPINSNFGASPTRFSLSTSRILLLSSKGARHTYIRFSASLSFRSTLPSAIRSYILRLCPYVPSPLVSTEYRSSFFYPSIFLLQPSPPSPVLRVRLPIFDSFDPENSSGIILHGKQVDVQSEMSQPNCFYP